MDKVFSKENKTLKQECIPGDAYRLLVDHILESASQGGGSAWSGGVCLVPGGSAWSWGVSAWSWGCLPGLGVCVCLVPGVVSAWSRGVSAWSGGVSAWSGGIWHPSMHWGRHPPPCGQTDTCKNITLATTSLRPVKILENWKNSGKVREFCQSGKVGTLKDWKSSIKHFPSGFRCRKLSPNLFSMSTKFSFDVPTLNLFFLPNSRFELTILPPGCPGEHLSCMSILTTRRRLYLKVLNDFVLFILCCRAMYKNFQSPCHQNVWQVYSLNRGVFH